jgi:lipopolysaccharide transport system ATP-binding protein
MEKPAIRIEKLSKRYYIGKDEARKDGHGLLGAVLLPYRMLRGAGLPGGDGRHIWALRDVNLQIRSGERVGIIGKNGAGKSTLLKVLSRLVHPTEGRVTIRGRVTSLLEVGTGFNPNLTGRENVYLNASLYGLTRDEIKERFDAIVEFSGVGKFIDTPVRHYSSGMHVRLAFAVIAHLDPDILMMDEVLAVGDIAFQQKCLQKVEGFASGGRTILFVSHSMGDIVRFCDRVVWLEDGRVVEDGEAKDVVAEYSKRMMKLQSSYKPEPSVQVAQEVKKDEAKGADQHPEALGAELLSFEITDAGGRAKELFLRSEPVHINVKYRALRDDIPLVVNVHLLKDGVHVLTTHSEKVFSAPVGSVCMAQTHIPANFLNRGVYDFSIAIVSPTRPILRHVKLDNILNFQICEEDDPERIFHGSYRGVVRPQFPWRFTVTGES